ncbi:MAG: V-type ATP synthase subunit E [Coriobacteriia bacterium]|nr:V-type ATP synthase subunit E [Coriobacteriia bacterium]
MAIEDIFRALEEQADSEVNQILHTATVQADAVEHEARDEADRITQGRIQVAEDAVRVKAAKAVNAARLEVRRNLAEVRDKALDSVFAEAAEHLSKMRGTAEYERVFGELAKEALKGLDGMCEIQVASADEALAKKVVGGLGVEFTVSPTLDTIGGLVVSAHEGRVVRRNTFESRLLKVRSVAGSSITEVLTS